MRRFEKSPALRRRLQATLLRGHKCSRKFGDGAQGRITVAGDRAMGVREKHRVAEAAAFAEHCGKPPPQCLGILDIAGLDCPLDTAGI